MAVFKVNDPRRTQSPWAVSFTGSDGRRKLRYCKTRKAADALLAQSQVKVQEGAYLDPRKSRTVAELADAFLEYKRADIASGGLRESTYADYAALAALYIKPGLGHLSLRDLNDEHVRRFRASLLSEPREAIQAARASAMAKCGGTADMHRARLGVVGARTVGKVLTLLKSMLNEAVQRGWTFRNAAQSIKHSTPQLEAVDAARVLTDAEAARLVERSDGMLRVMLLVALRTGIRQGEQMALTWGDVDLDGMRLHIRRSVRNRVLTPPKTRYGARVVPLDVVLIRELKKWKLACPPTPSRLVFPDAHGGHQTGPAVSRQFRALIRRCGFERPELASFRWHDLRHCLASHALSAGMPLIDVSRLLGHSSPKVTSDVYAHAIFDREEERRELLNTLYARVS